MDAIEEARQNTGEFRLKSSEGYIAPEHKKLSAAIVKKRIIAVEKQVCLQLLYLAFNRDPCFSVYFSLNGPKTVLLALQTFALQFQDYM